MAKMQMNNRFTKENDKGLVCKEKTEFFDT
jgi:hypothetical protein